MLVYYLMPLNKQTNEGTEGRRRAINNINNEYGKYLPNLLTEKSSLQELEAAYKAITRAIQETTAAKAKQKAIEESTGDSIDKQISLMGDLEKSVSKTFGITNNKLSSEIVKDFKKSIEESYKQGENSIKAASNAISKIRDKYQIKDPLALADIGTDLKKFSLEIYRYNNDIRRIQEQFSPFFDKESADKDIIQNKEYWEEIKRQAESALEAINSKQRKLLNQGITTGIPQNVIDSYTKASEALKQANEQLKVYETSKTKDVNYYKLEKDTINAYNALENAIREGELKIEQTSINLMEEDGEKQLAQLNLNFQKRMDAVSKQTDEYVKMVQDQELKAWKEKNPTKKESEYSYKTVDYKTLPKEFQDIIDEMIETENQLYEKSIQDYFDSVAKGFRGYLEKREAIEKEFAEKRKTLVHSGAPQSSLSELDYQEDETLQKIDLEFAQREQTFQRWANQVAKLSLDELRRLLIEAEFEMNKQQNLHPDDANSNAVARAKVATIRKKINEVDITPNKNGKNPNKEWQKLYKTLGDINNSFQDIGDSVGGVAGEIIKTAGKVSTSTLQIIDGIKTLTQNSTSAIQATATTAATAISTVEKASVILAIISAALKVATAIAGLFKKNDYMEEFRKETEKLNYELVLVKINSEIDSDKNNIFGNDFWKNALDNIRAANNALKLYNEALDKIINRAHSERKGPLDSIRDIKRGYDSLAASIGNMQLQVQHSTWFRSASYVSLKDALPELFDENGDVDIEALKKFMGTDTFKKLSEENQRYLDEMLGYWNAYQDAIDSIKDYLSDIFGDLGETISDALVDAFESGTDAAKAFTKSVSEILEKLATQMAYSIFLGPKLEKAQEEIKDIMLDQALSEAEKFKKAGEIVDRATVEIMNDQQKYDNWLEERKQEAKDKGYDIFNPENKSSLFKSIQGISEDTAGAIGSYLNAMRADLSVNRGNLQALVDNAIPFFNDFVLRVADLKHLETIANNTGRNADVAQRILDRLVAMTTAGSATKVNIK